MTIDVDTWGPLLAGDEMLRRLRRINEANGYNTTPHVEDGFIFPSQIPEENLPALLCFEDSIDSSDVTGGDGVARGKIRLLCNWQIWGVVTSQYSLRRAAHELLADAKSALYTDEGLDTPTGSRTTYRILWGEFTQEMTALADMPRAFWMWNVQLELDIVRKE